MFTKCHVVGYWTEGLDEGCSRVKLEGEDPGPGVWAPSARSNVMLMEEGDGKQGQGEARLNSLLEVLTSIPIPI